MIRPGAAWCLLLAFLPAFSQFLPPDAGPLCDTIIAHQKKISTLRCNYHHKRFLNDKLQLEYQGVIDYQAPNLLLMHFLFPADEYVLVTDTTVLIYGVKNAFGIRYDKKCLSDAEKQIAEQIGQIKMNLLETMRPSYTFTYSDSSNPRATILSAVPLSGWKSLSKILITVDREKKYCSKIDIYGKDGIRISSSGYANPVYLDSADAWFPRTVTVALALGTTEQKDIITYTRVDGTRQFGKNHFSVPQAKNAQIKDNRNDCK